MISRYRDYFTAKLQARFGKGYTSNRKPSREENHTSESISHPEHSTMPTESTPTQSGWISDTTKTTATITTDLESASHSLRSVFRDLKSITPEDANTLLQLFTSEIKGVQDDDTLLLEKTVQLLSSQPETSGIGKSLTANFVNTLWDALPHPPLRSLGTQYRYREADGGNNNIRMPDLGRAGMPYAKSVKAERMKRRSLPDPGELFDGLMRRDENGEENGKDGFKGSETGISSWLFYLATIIIHDLFLTVCRFHSNSNNTGKFKMLISER